MKKMLLIILTICCVICLYSCANESVNNPQDSIINNEIITDETSDILDTEDPDMGDNDMGETSSEIGGAHMGDLLYTPYPYYVDGVVKKKNTFSENYAAYMDEYVQMEGKWENNRPAVLYYLVHKMELTRDDLETYFTALGYENVPDSVYSGLLSETLEESMQLLKTEYAFYNNGKLYTIYDVYEMQETRSFAFDINDAAYDTVWENINAYLNSEYAYDVGENITQFVSQKADAIK